MSTLSSVLPKPRHQISSFEEQEPENNLTDLAETQQRKQPPPYGQRAGWKPRTISDFGGGGAFPEIHIAQYPLDMGRNKATSGGSLSLQVDAEGSINYDAIAKQGHSDSRRVYSQFKDLVPLNQRADIDVEQVSLERPDEEVVKETTEKTREALEKIVQGKIKAAQPKNVKSDKPSEPTYVRYTPGQQGEAYNSGAKQRIIRMVDMPVDPMEPPKFKHKKIPRGPPSPPAPILHSPPRKVSAKEQQEWVIPPCISNWKNTKGYTIPLDKRLAADGRGLQEVTINDNFAKLSEALFVADRHAREEVRQRSLMREKLAQKEKEEKEKKLRMLAQRAREERAGISSTIVDSGKANAEDSDDSENEGKAVEREELRQERRRERERELRLSRMGAEQKAKYLAREQNRDISEKIALGLAKPTISKDSLYDSRLFNQTEGLSSGFKDDEAYDLYDKPLFAGSSASSIYNPKKNYDSDLFGGGNEEQITQMLNVDKFGIVSNSFKGADLSQARDGPVEFEKEEADLLGINQFLDAAKKGNKRGLETTGESSKSKRSRE